MAECLIMKRTLGLLVCLWLASGLTAEALAIKDRPLKVVNIIRGPIALARQLEWL